MTGNAVSKWSDDFMFTAEKSDASKGPQVMLLSGNNDPLGSIAASAKMYKGEVVRHLSEVTDAERIEYLREMQKTKLMMPMEGVNLHFMIEGVTRGFTHQLVRQRTAAYAQESTRFAVKEDLKTATALPPSLAGTKSARQLYSEQVILNETSETFEEFEDRIAGSSKLSREQRWRLAWDMAVDQVGETYNLLVNDGMPAEDARGLMPTNITTRTNYITNLRGLLDHAGNRLCTQAQFEWRLVFNQIAKALRDYGRTQVYETDHPSSEVHEVMVFPQGTHANYECSSAWQWNAIADLLRPVCYQTGKCAFMADFDRKCSIRPRVQANAEINRPSKVWDQEFRTEDADTATNYAVAGIGKTAQEGGTYTYIGPISPMEWLADPASAR